MGGIDQSIGPGLGGFIAFFLLALALWLLMRNMNKHLRNVSYMRERAEYEHEHAMEVDEAGATEATPDEAKAARPAGTGDAGSADERGA